MDDLQKLRARLTDMEIKFSFQEETIEILNDTITKQWDVIDQLKREVNAIKNHLLKVGAEKKTLGVLEPPPPHY